MGDAVPSVAPPFEALAALLATHRALWAGRPFVHTRLPWQAEHPEVATWLLAQSPRGLEALEAPGAQLPPEAPAALRGWAEEAARLSAVCELPTLPCPKLNSKKWRRRVAPRKWAQVQAFVAAAQPQLRPEDRRAVDWCAGKGHLGRALTVATGLPVAQLELSAPLCRAGEALHRFYGVPDPDFHAVDVLRGGAAFLGPGTLGVALHACGILWRTLLQDACQAGASAIVAPCCYHQLGGATEYHPLSRRGFEQGLEFSQHDLRLATTDESMASEGVKARRRREQSWRLGLDLLLREASGQDKYVPLGPLTKAILDLDFEPFCRAVAQRVQLELPAQWSPPRAQAAGEARAHQVSALGVVRALFRRPLELWLVLDAAMHQQELGRRVTLGSFCETGLTPRNLMLISAPA